MIIDKKCAYIISPYGIGDLVLVCGLKKSIEKRYGLNIRYIVKPSHEIVMEMFGEKEYIIGTFSEAELKIIGEEVKEPTIGKMFVSHPFYHDNGRFNTDFLEYRINFKSLFTKVLDLQENSIVDLPQYFPQVQDQFKRKARIELMDRTVLLLPEMKSSSLYENLPVDIFVELISKLKNAGLYPIVNCTNDTYKELIPYSVDMTLEEVVGLACQCKQTISMRSGICDLIFSQIKKLEIIYPNYAFWKLFNLSDTYGSGWTCCINEHVLSVSKALRNIGYKSCALYGYGSVGKRIRYSLESEGFPVSYIIDINKDDVNCSLDVYGIEERLPNTDVILITLSNQIEEVKNKLFEIFNGDVIDLHEMWLKSDILKEMTFYENYPNCE